MSFSAQILTLFPDMFPGTLGQSLAGKALSENKWSYAAHDIRCFTTDRHRTVDDHPAGGGAGMVIKPNILARAIDATPHKGPRLLMSPRGKPFTQSFAQIMWLSKMIRMTQMCVTVSSIITLHCSNILCCCTFISLNAKARCVI